MNNDAQSQPRILVTCGEPGGIGPDIVLQTAVDSPGFVAVGCREVLQSRAAMLGLKVQFAPPETEASAGILPLLHLPCMAKVAPGKPTPATAAHVIACIDHATDLCVQKKFDAMVTAPVNKAVLRRDGYDFGGHTEWIAARCKTAVPVMMLAHRSEKAAMRVCLLTNHLPLAEVPKRITAARLHSVIRVIVADLRARFGIARPRLGVCGLNPHAGEGGYLGREDVEVIAPALDALRREFADAKASAELVGPLPADTAFTPARLAELDAVLAMYHDQGLPVIKHCGFGATVNVTLGLPIVRTSVDHGTAEGLAGSGRADASGLRAAIAMAGELATKNNV